MQSAAGNVRNWLNLGDAAVRGVALFPGTAVYVGKSAYTREGRLSGRYANISVSRLSATRANEGRERRGAGQRPSEHDAAHKGRRSFVFLQCRLCTGLSSIYCVVGVQESMYSTTTRPRSTTSTESTHDTSTEKILMVLLLYHETPLICRSRFCVCLIMTTNKIPQGNRPSRHDGR